MPRVKFTFVHGMALGLELVPYRALNLPDDFDPNDEAAMDKLLSNPPDDLVKDRSGVLFHLLCFKLLVI